MLVLLPLCSFFFFFNDTATTEIYTLSLHDALPISSSRPMWPSNTRSPRRNARRRSEEHTSELQSQVHLVCRLLLEKKKQSKIATRSQKSEAEKQDQTTQKTSA